MPSISVKPFRKSCTLWIHDDTFSSERVLFNADLLPDQALHRDRFLKVTADPTHADHDHAHAQSRTIGARGIINSRSRPKQTPLRQSYVFIAQPLTPSENGKFRNLQISVSKDVAEVHGFYNRMQVIVEDADAEQHAASHVELNFSDPLNRADLWKTTISELSRRRCIHQGQELLFLGSIKIFVKKLFVSGQRVPSAVFTKDSKPIFRSTSARFILGLQVSLEMFQDDDDLSGNTSWNWAMHFVLSLLERWKLKKTNHMLSIVLFTRLREYYKSVGHPAGHVDLYRVVTSDAPVFETTQVLRSLQKTYKDFAHEIRSHCLGRYSSNMQLTTARHGNMLEAINVAISACWLDDLDLDFVRTGTSIIMLSPNAGTFEVDENLLRITGERLINRSIGVELVCLAARPLHVVPLFMLAARTTPTRRSSLLAAAETQSSRSEASSRARNTIVSDAVDKTGSMSPVDASPDADPVRNICVLPSWVETSYYVSQGQSATLFEVICSAESHRLQGTFRAQDPRMSSTLLYVRSNLTKYVYHLHGSIEAHTDRATGQKLPTLTVLKLQIASLTNTFTVMNA